MLQQRGVKLRPPCLSHTTNSRDQRVGAVRRPGLKRLSSLSTDAALAQLRAAARSSRAIALPLCCRSTSTNSLNSAGKTSLPRIAIGRTPAVPHTSPSRAPSGVTSSAVASTGSRQSKPSCHGKRLPLAVRIGTQEFDHRRPARRRPTDRHAAPHERPLQLPQPAARMIERLGIGNRDPCPSVQASRATAVRQHVRKDRNCG